MKIYINFGKIKNFSMEIKDLNVIEGNNASDISKSISFLEK